MKNEKLENKKISDDSLKNISGGFRIHITTNEEYPKKDALYLNKKQFETLEKAGIISKDKKIHEDDLEKALLTISNNNAYTVTHMQKLTTRDKNSDEIKVDLIDTPR